MTSDSDEDTSKSPPTFDDPSAYVCSEKMSINENRICEDIQGIPTKEKNLNLERRESEGERRKMKEE